MTNKHNTILIIDDNAINRKYLKSVFSNDKYNPILCSGGKEALEKLKTNKANLVLVDIQMPEMDGFECYNQIRQQYELRCPIIAITAFSDQTDKQEILDFGFNDYIAKPVKPDTLLGIVNFWLSRFNSNDKLSSPMNENLEHIDHDILNDLLRFTDAQSLLSLIDEFVEETRSDIQSIAKFKESDRHSEILSILHTIKGNAGSFGFTVLSSLAAEIEVKIKSKQLETIDSDLDGFIEYSDSLLRDYHRLLKIN
ncbi:response regulator [Roseivirga sp.]|uniref:response regulator n=1 Tax=Roseivirga sp. TaxID=1964215 RepID=UPI003B5170D4